MKTLSVITLLFISFISGCFVSKNKADVQAQKISVINTLFNEKSATVDKKIVIFKSAIDTIAKPGLKTISQKIPPYKTLREAYINYFPVGTAITPETDLNDPKIAEFIKTQYSSLTGKQSMQPFRIHPYEDSFRWDQADMLVNFAQQNNMAVRGHCLIYSTRDKHMPAWFFKDSENIASKELVLKRMEEHITRIVSRYKGKVYCWDVVNEAVSNKKGEYLRSNDPLYKIVGEEYIAKAFEYAHAADTAAKLFYNDNFDDHSPQKRTEIYKLLKRLKDNGVPIDGIGMQCHLGISGISREYLQETIDLFKSIGLEFQITELDVSIYNRYLKQDQMLGLSDKYTPDIQTTQANVYKMIFDVCRQNKGVVTGLTFWGYADNDDEPNSLTKRLGKKNYPFLFDKNLEPKKALKEITEFKP